MSLTFDFPHAIDQVFAKLTNPQYLEARSKDLGELSATCTVQTEGNKTVVTMKRQVERSLPSFAQKLFNSVQVINLQEEWQKSGDGYQGSYQIEIEGQPVSISADFSLRVKGDGASYSITHHCKAKIPIIGKKIEKYIQGQTEDGAREELNHALKSL